MLYFITFPCSDRHKLRLLFPKTISELVSKRLPYPNISFLSLFSVSRIEIPRKKFAALIGPQLSQASDHKKKKGAIISMLLTASPIVSRLVAPCQQSRALFLRPKLQRFKRYFLAGLFKADQDYIKSRDIFVSHFFDRNFPIIIV